MSQAQTTSISRKPAAARPQPPRATRDAPHTVVSFEALLAQLESYLPSEQVKRVCSAHDYAQAAHEGQHRRTGYPYITHPVAVAHILAEMHMDHQTLMAALLHDVIEDTGVPKGALRERFGEAVADLVDGVSKLATIFHSPAEAQAENFRKMAMAMARDIRVILLKLADRLHNMRTLDALPRHKQRRIARETLEFYAPIASRLGMDALRVESEDLAFAALHPMRAARIARAVRAARRNRRELVEQVRQSLDDCLASEGIDATVIGREKHLYSIYRKMRAKRRSFAELMDVFAFRIIVDRADTSYRVLGAVHNLYKPVAGRFKDYIAIPKANGYQSLHTTLFGMHGVPIEIQIRTQQMDAIANNGIAGHWLYKAEDAERDSASHARARRWVNGLLEMQRRAGDSLEFIEHLKTDLFPDEVYVFTPKGRIMELPSGASPVDFAYAVHTDVGNTCVACRVDRRLAPLSAQLQSGQTVEIITAQDSRPNPDWLSFAVTGKARSSVRHALKHQRVAESRALGRRLLSRSLENAGSSLTDIDDHHIERIVAELGFKHLDNLLEDIGLGNRLAYAVARRLSEGHEHVEHDALSVQQGGPLAIRGCEGLVVSYGKCCHPLPGDIIIGHVSSGKGLVVHEASCRNLNELRAKGDELIPVRWSETVEGEFSTHLRVEVEPKKGVIAALASAITSEDANIEHINIIERTARLSTAHLALAVRGRVHLAAVMRRLRGLPNVFSLARSKS